MADYFTAMFRRRPNDGWFRAGRFDLTTTDIMCGLAVVTMFVYGLMGADDWWRLPFQSIWVREDLDVWRLVTWPIATQPDAWGVLGIVFFWVFGQQLEALFGRDRFLAWVLSVTVVPAVLLTVLGAISAEIDTTNGHYGLSMIFTCGIWVLAATYPQLRWFDVVPLWAVAAVFTLLDLLQYNGNGMTGRVLFVLIAVATSLLAGRALGQATGWPIPHLQIGGRSGSTKAARGGRGGRHAAGRPPAARPGAGRGSGSGSVVEGPWVAPPPPARPSPDARAAQAELDSLLDKISGSGLDSLSAAEKRRLNELSKQLRD